MKAVIAWEYDDLVPVSASVGGCICRTAPSENRKAPMKKAPPDMSVFLWKKCTPPRRNSMVEANLMHVKTPDAMRLEFCPLCNKISRLPSQGLGPAAALTNNQSPRRQLVRTRREHKIQRLRVYMPTMMAGADYVRKGWHYGQTTWRKSPRPKPKGL